MGDHASYPHAPTWRDWKPDAEEAPNAEFYAAVEAVSARALEDAGTNSQRWIQLLSKITGFPASIRAEFIDEMSGLDREDFNERERASLHEMLRGVISDHREFPDAVWAMSGAEVDQLAEILAYLEPDSPAAKHAWLFKQGAARSFGERGEDERFAALATAQIEAVQEIYAVNGLFDVLIWSEQFEAHSVFEVGKALARIGLNKDIENAIFSALASEVEAHRVVARGYMLQTAWSRGEGLMSWVETTLSERADGWSSTQKAEFLVLFGAAPEFWDFAETFGEETEHEYWSRVQPYGVPDNEEVLIRFARKLLENGRPYTVVDFLDFRAESISTETLNELSAEALELAAQTSPPAQLNSFPYHAGRHFDRLDEAGFDENRLAMLEWIYLPLFQHGERHSRVLHRALATDPAFFAQVISFVYADDEAEPQELSDEQLSRAESARILLNTWRLVPGTREDGSIDGEILKNWVDEARRLLAECNRSKSGEQQLGEVLRYGPPPEGDLWPAEAIQDIIEEIASEALEDSFQMEVYNSRGVTTRDPTDGGEQERALANQYRRYAASAAFTRPRTAALLSRIVDSYEQDARRHDTDAELTEDLWR